MLITVLSPEVPQRDTAVLPIALMCLARSTRRYHDRQFKRGLTLRSAGARLFWGRDTNRQLPVCLGLIYTRLLRSSSPVALPESLSHSRHLHPSRCRSALLVGASRLLGFFSLSLSVRHLLAGAYGEAADIRALSFSFFHTLPLSHPSLSLFISWNRPAATRRPRLNNALEPRIRLFSPAISVYFV